MKRFLIFAVAIFVTTIVVFAQKAKLTGETMPVPNLPVRVTTAMGGDAFMHICDTTGFWKREDLIVAQVKAGNMPEEMHRLHKIEFTTAVIDTIDVLRKPHKVELWVSCDYIAIGSSADYVRMPMGPLAAQRIADALDCVLPTSLIVDRINDVAQGALDIFPFRPLGARNMQPIVFQDSNNAIKALYKAKGYRYGQFVSGLKKDIILSCRLKEPEYRRNVAIYGWHHPDGHAQQPIHVRHGNFYADYSHGVRLVYRTAVIDGVAHDIRGILEDANLYRLLSNEARPIVPATYAGDEPWK